MVLKVLKYIKGTYLLTWCMLDVTWKAYNLSLYKMELWDTFSFNYQLQEEINI